MDPVVHEFFHHLQSVAGSLIVQLGIANNSNFPQQSLGPDGQQFGVAGANAHAIETPNSNHYPTYCTTTLTSRPGT